MNDVAPTLRSLPFSRDVIHVSIHICTVKPEEEYVVNSQCRMFNSALERWYLD